MASQQPPRDNSKSEDVDAGDVTLHSSGRQISLQLHADGARVTGLRMDGKKLYLTIEAELESPLPSAENDLSLGNQGMAQAESAGAPRDFSDTNPESAEPASMEKFTLHKSVSNQPLPVLDQPPMQGTTRSFGRFVDAKSGPDVRPLGASQEESSELIPPLKLERKSESRIFDPGSPKFAPPVEPLLSKGGADNTLQEDAVKQQPLALDEPPAPRDQQALHAPTPKPLTGFGFSDQSDYVDDDLPGFSPAPSFAPPPLPVDKREKGREAFALGNGEGKEAGRTVPHFGFSNDSDVLDPNFIGKVEPPAAPIRFGDSGVGDRALLDDLIDLPRGKPGSQHTPIQPLDDAGANAWRDERLDTLSLSVDETENFDMPALGFESESSEPERFKTIKMSQPAVSAGLDSIEGKPLAAAANAGSRLSDGLDSEDETAVLGGDRHGEPRPAAEWAVDLPSPASMPERPSPLSVSMGSPESGFAPTTRPDTANAPSSAVFAPLADEGHSSAKQMPTAKFEESAPISAAASSSSSFVSAPSPAPSSTPPHISEKWTASQKSSTVMPLPPASPEPPAMSSPESNKWATSKSSVVVPPASSEPQAASSPASNKWAASSKSSDSSPLPSTGSDDEAPSISDKLATLPKLPQPEKDAAPLSGAGKSEESKSSASSRRSAPGASSDEEKVGQGKTTVLVRYTCPKCKTQGMQSVDKVGMVVTCSNCGKAMRLVMKK